MDSLDETNTILCDTHLSRNYLPCPPATAATNKSSGNIVNPMANPIPSISTANPTCSPVDDQGTRSARSLQRSAADRKGCGIFLTLDVERINRVTIDGDKLEDEVMLDYDSVYNDDGFEIGYRISGFTGDSRIWNRNSRFVDVNSALMLKLVPSEGKADTVHGELLRSINNLVYDIFNNGLCNDKLEEIEFLLQYSDLFKPYLSKVTSLGVLRSLEKTYSRRFPESIEMNQENCDKLDDVTEAVIQYVASVEQV